MKIIGLTGSVASGKNFVGEWFARLGIPVFDADREVHKIFSSDKQIIKKISQIFPEALDDNKINRTKLGKLTLGKRENLRVLEGLIHPLVRQKEQEFIRKSALKGYKKVILNIPLLFEKADYSRCDKIIVVEAPRLIQKERFIKRVKENKDGKNLEISEIEKKFNQILDYQLPVYSKKKLADFTIQNGLDKNFTLRQIKKIYKKL